jgi:hypothetical protein
MDVGMEESQVARNSDFDIAYLDLPKGVWYYEECHAKGYSSQAKRRF